MPDVVIVAAGRSPIGKRDGSLSQTHPADVLGPVQMEVLRRAGVEPATVGQVVGGCINKVGAQSMNITRTAWLSHGGPAEVAAITVDSQCGSSQHAVNLAHSLIAAGQEDTVLACGVEIMSKLPIGADAVAGTKAGMGKPISRTYWAHHEFISQFEGAERIATKYGVTRDDTDAFGLRSQERAAAAIADGAFDDQLVEVADFTRDEVPRDTSLELLGRLKPVAREDGVHTAGTSSQIADGASAVLLMSDAEAQRRGLTPLARIVSAVLVGCDPVLMLEGPIPATEKMLAQTGLGIDDIDVFEVNEAFASIVLSWQKTVGADPDRVNPNGGAIALGHPLGATGCFLTTKAVHELHRSDGRYALISMCCGGGLGTGTLVERL